jgi:uncharacterized CHY-type Zn-finger protein
MKRVLPGITIVFVLFFVAVLTASTLFAAPKRLPTAKAGNCVACHGTQKVLPADHPATKSMTFKDCLGCHEKTGPQKLEGKLPGSHLHMLGGITCGKCHKNVKKAEAVSMEQCAACHNPEKLAEQTAKVKPSNPHTSPHYGTSLDCNVCHHQHQKSENFCSQCHDFNFPVP